MRDWQIQCTLHNLCGTAEGRLARIQLQCRDEQISSIEDRDEKDGKTRKLPSCIPNHLNSGNLAGGKGATNILSLGLSIHFTLFLVYFYSLD